MGNIYRAKRELIESFGLDIPKKHNLVLDASSDFRSPSGGWEDTYFTGEKIKVIQLPFHQFEYLYIPYSVVGCYMHMLNGGIESVLDYQFVPLCKTDKLILVRPTGLLSGSIYFQYFLTDSLTPIKILDVYEKINFEVTPSNYVLMEIPFPTYEFELIVLVPTPSDSWGFDIDIYPFTTSDTFVLDDVSGLVGTDTVINTIYKYDFVGGSGAVSNPHYTHPSYRTKIKISNDDAVNSMPSLRLRLISFEGSR